jgi:hypothetical protein
VKQQDIATILLVIGFSAVVSLFVSKAIFAPPKNRQQSIQQVQAITSDFPMPSAKYFNSQALDPTKPITVGQNVNNNPFNNNPQ